MNLTKRDRESIWHPYTQSGIFPDNIGIVSGKDALLFDENGKSYIDAISSWWVNLHGHSNEVINEAVKSQIDTLEQVIFAGFTHEPAIQLSENLLQLQPHFGKVFFSDNGSTAVEVALKAALQFWKNKGIHTKKKIIAFKHSYHGDTFGAMSLSGRSLFTEHYKDYLFEVIHIPLPDDHHNSEYFSLVENLVSKKDVAAFVYEPLVLGSGGMLMYDESALSQLLAIFRNHEVLLIADEVMTGFGRTGTLFASDRITVKPDMMCLSKGLTGGYLPMGLTMFSEEIYQTFKSTDFSRTLFHGHSFTGNLLSCAAANASLKLTVSAACSNARTFISHSHLRFSDELRNFGCIENIRTCGTILAFDLKVDDSGYASAVRKEILEFFLSNGVLIRPLGNVIYLLPPYCISPEQLQFCYDRILEFLNKFEGKRV